MPTREDWQRRLGPLYGGAVALVHSTPWRWPDAVADDARSPTWIVALGIPIGLVSWVISALARGAGMPPVIGAILGIAMLTIASAAIVERGVADRFGAHGQLTSASVLALVFLTALRIAAFAAVPPSAWLAVLVASALTGRWAAVFLQAIGDPIPEGAGRSLVATPAPAWLTAAISIAVAALLVVALGKLGIVALVFVGAAVFVIGLDAHRRDGGLTAPIVATAAAVGELAVLLIATIVS